MKNLTTLVTLLLLILFSCQSNKIDDIQGVYTVDKELLKKELMNNLKDENNQTALSTAVLDKAIENSVIELNVSGDSLKGLMFLAGQTSLINSKIFYRNDSMLINTDGDDAYIIPNSDGFLFQNVGSKMHIQMIKADQKKLSKDTEMAIDNLLQKKAEVKEFEESIGKWKIGNYVDDFGDKTGEGYPYCIVKGEHTNSAVVKSDVFVKAYLEGGKFIFQIFNSSMTLKESFPDNEFGYIKIKYPDDDVEREKVFFFKNYILESPGDEKPLVHDFLLNEDGELKILIDVSTASKYYSDKYQFILKSNNLKEIISSLKNN
ncbi:hypothetical protein [Luteibaculum oceani]|uniref:DUF4292 domain-containing protein n=1 Tax=Luteibaculum oceani TaxID=1294296 RepID=A0A5C6UY66_9FLAO|nr:hypothetical protein [Luteibaculum oceani]TXC78352.1 hypothetical protein FRX97_08460 [Luteibaculum oceani]